MYDVKIPKTHEKEKALETKFNSSSNNIPCIMKLSYLLIEQSPIVELQHAFVFKMGRISSPNIFAR